MNDLAELKQFVVAHAISQNLAADHYAALLDAITVDGPDGPGSWSHEWIRAGEQLDAAGQTLAACQYYNMGRFPFVDGPGRARALARCVNAFDRWRQTQSGLDTAEIPVDGRQVRVLTTGLSAQDPRPLVIMTGGIVSPKEQWGAVLPQLAQFGLAGVVADLPGVGESPLDYEAQSWRLFPAILDALSGQAQVERTYLLALSFSGHLAVTAALHDPRIRGIVGNGLPVHGFFTDATWWRGVPKVTRDTLAHLVGIPGEEIFARIGPWALTEEQLRALDIPLAVVAARRDEIIPPADISWLRKAVRDLRLVEHDDVHGAPKHLAETRLWSLHAILDMWPGADPGQRDLLAAAMVQARLGAP